MQAIANRWASRISLSREDREDATNEILMHLVEKAQPEHMRRVSSMTGNRIAGYSYRPGRNAHGYFAGAARTKALDILKSRRAAWKNKHAVLSNLLDYGAMVTLPHDIEN